MGRISHIVGNCVLVVCTSLKDCRSVEEGKIHECQRSEGRYGRERKQGLVT